MKINRKSLTDILGMVKCGLASKEVVENSTCFIFKGGRVLTYNDDVAVSHPLDLGLEGAVKGKEFEALLNKMNDEEVEIFVDPELTGVLRVKGVKTNAKLRLEENANIDDILNMLGDPQNWSSLPETFRPSVDFCQFSVGRDPNKPLLTTVYCGMVTNHDTGEENAVTISSDDNRITICELGEGIVLDPFCLPATAVKELKAFLPVEYAFTEGWIHFRTKDNVMFSSRILMGTYPADKCKEICNSVHGETVKLPNGLIESLDRAGIFASGDSGSVSVELKDGFLTVTGEGEAGSVEEAARLRYHGDEVKFDVAPDFLKAILQHTSEAIIAPGLLQFSGLGFVHVMATKVK